MYYKYFNKYIILKYYIKLYFNIIYKNVKILC